MFRSQQRNADLVVMERSLVAKAVVGSPVTMGYPIRRVRVPSLSAILFDNRGAGVRSAIALIAANRVAHVARSVSKYDKAD